MWIKQWKYNSLNRDILVQISVDFMTVKRMFGPKFMIFQWLCITKQQPYYENMEGITVGSCLEENVRDHTQVDPHSIPFLDPILDIFYPNVEPQFNPQIISVICITKTAGQVLKKSLGWIMSNFWGQFFHVFGDKKNQNQNSLAFALKNCIIPFLSNNFWFFFAPENMKKPGDF